jgi:hypothetical protein
LSEEPGAIVSHAGICAGRGWVTAPSTATDSENGQESKMGVEQHQRIVLQGVGIAAALLLLTACRAQAITQAPLNAIVIESARVVPLGHIEFEGRSTLPDGTCLLTELSADGMPETWWPADACAVIESGQWQIRVLLGNNGVPQELSGEKQYILRVWKRGNPSVKAEPFWFDLSGPPVYEE